jgi:hypothetical protein
MKDDLEQRLRDGLHRGALPAAPDALRDRLSRLPAESRGPRLAGLVSGLRLAGLATAAAVAIAFVLVVRSLPGPTGTGPAASLGSVATSTPAPTATVSTAPSATLPTSIPASPSSGPTPSESFNCSGSQVAPATTKTVAQITDVRVGTHPGYDRIVFEFAGSGRPQLTVAQAFSPFVQDASGKTVNVPGNAFLSLKLFDASGYPTYQGPSSFSPGYPNLIALVNTGDYEGYVTWIAGLRDMNSVCYSISTLTGPTRIVIDILAVGPNPS